MKMQQYHDSSSNSRLKSRPPISFEELKCSKIEIKISFSRVKGTTQSCCVLHLCKDGLFPPLIVFKPTL